MSEFTTLSLLHERFRNVPFPVKRPAQNNSEIVRNALLALLAANIFVISGALCFGYLWLGQ